MPISCINKSVSHCVGTWGYKNISQNSMESSYAVEKGSQGGGQMEKDPCYADQMTDPWY